MDEKLRITEDDGETIDIWLTKEITPIAYERKKWELVNKCGMTEDEAEIALARTPFELQLFYSMEQGLFGFESEAKECCEIYDPYTGEEIPNDNLIYKNKDES